MARRCGICGNPTRKGSTQRVMMLATDGELHSTVACARCVNRGVTLVTRPHTDPLGIKAEGLSEAEKDVRSVLRALARYYRNLGRTQLSEEETEAMQTCANVADAWAARPQVRQE